MPTLTSFNFNSLHVVGCLLVVEIFLVWDVGMFLFCFFDDTGVQGCLQICCFEKGRV